MSDLCTWCGNDFEPRNNGGKPQRFCSKDCRENFNTAYRIWAAGEYEAERVSIFDLRTAFYQHTRCVQRDLPQGATQDAPEDERRSTGLVAARSPEAA